VSPIKVVISVDPATGASAPVWAATADMSAPVWAAATAPLGVRSCPLCNLLSRCLPRQLELIVGAAIGRDRATGAIATQSLELYSRHT
jgi:hypothetical protein